MENACGRKKLVQFDPSINKQRDMDFADNFWFTRLQWTSGTMFITCGYPRSIKLIHRIINCF